MLLLVLCAVFAPYLAPYDPYAIDVKDRLLPRSRSIYLAPMISAATCSAACLYGARTTIQAGLVVILIAAIFRSVIGLISGYYGGKTDLFTMRFIDIMLAFPYILLALAIVATLGPSLQNALIAIGIAFIPGWARFVRGSVLSTKKQEYVTSAGAVGACSSRIMRSHVLVNILPGIIVLASLDFPAAVLSTAVLSYVGLGAQPPTAEWGALLTGACAS